MQIIQGFEFYPLTFDEKGLLTSRKEFDTLVQQMGGGPAGDVIFLAHGFRNDVADATTLYTDFLTTFRAHLSRPEFQAIAGRRYGVAGVFWPSKQFSESFDSGSKGARGVRRQPTMADAKAQLKDLQRDASPAKRKKLQRAITLLPSLEKSRAKQDEFVKLVLSLVDRSVLDATEGLPQLKKRKGSEVLSRLRAPSGAGTRGLGDVFGTIAGGVGEFLNLTTWYVMKDRSGTVGAKGVAAAVRALHGSRAETRLHLVGHSLGGRLMAACAKSLCAAPKVQPDSLTLLEAAFSHFGFSPDNGHKQAGFFRDVITKAIVRGPLVSTFSAQDTVVGHAYAVTSRLAGDNTREIGDATDEFGGIGRNGPQKTPEVASSPLHKPGTPYDFTIGVINNLDGSGGLIKDHGDVTNTTVTYAFASAIART